MSSEQPPGNPWASCRSSRHAQKLGVCHVACAWRESSCDALQVGSFGLRLRFRSTAREPWLLAVSSRPFPLEITTLAWYCGVARCSPQNDGLHDHVSVQIFFLTNKRNWFSHNCKHAPVSCTGAHSPMLLSQP